MTCPSTRSEGAAQLLALGIIVVAVFGALGCGAKSDRPDGTPWDPYILAMDDALARDDFYAADLARRTAHLLALGSHRWDAMADVGDACVRFLDAPGAGPTVRAECRHMYRSALAGARQQASIDGVLRVSEASTALGDQDMAREGLALATAMVSSFGAPAQLVRLKALEARLSRGADRVDPSRAEISEPTAAAVTWQR